MEFILKNIVWIIAALVVLAVTALVIRSRRRRRDHLSLPEIPRIDASHMRPPAASPPPAGSLRDRPAAMNQPPGPTAPASRSRSASREEQSRDRSAPINRIGKSFGKTDSRPPEDSDEIPSFIRRAADETPPEKEDDRSTFIRRREGPGADPADDDIPAFIRKRHETIAPDDEIHITGSTGKKDDSAPLDEPRPTRGPPKINSLPGRRMDEEREDSMPFVPARIDASEDEDTGAPPQTDYIHSMPEYSVGLGGDEDEDDLDTAEFVIDPELRATMERIVSDVGQVEGAPAMSEAEPEEEIMLGASAPQHIEKGTEFIARFVAHIESLEDEMKLMLNKLSPRAEFVSGIKRSRWKMGTEITVKCYGNHLNVDPSEDTFVWDGRSQVVEFDVTTTADTPDTVTVLKFDAYIDGIRVARLRIDLDISSVKATGPRVSVKAEPIRTAFASYASEDSLRVLDRISEIRKNGVDVFLDCLSLNPGDVWKLKLEKEIVDRSILLLFWSTNAKNSTWVEWEWRTALRHKGLDGIDPHPLEPVSVAAPPEELSALHFGDPYVTIRRTHEEK